MPAAWPEDDPQPALDVVAPVVGQLVAGLMRAAGQRDQAKLLGPAHIVSIRAEIAATQRAGCVV